MDPGTFALNLLFVAYVSPVSFAFFFFFLFVLSGNG